MARTRIEDLPKDIKISRNEMGRILGGVMETYEEEVEFHDSTPQGEISGYDIPLEYPIDPGLIGQVGAKKKAKKMVY
jgi:hypothetical protein